MLGFHQVPPFQLLGLNRVYCTLTVGNWRYPLFNTDKTRLQRNRFLLKLDHYRKLQAKCKCTVQAVTVDEFPVYVQVNQEQDLDMKVPT